MYPFVLALHVISVPRFHGGRPTLDWRIGPQLLFDEIGA